jgi:hypothetical protein
VGTPLTVNRYTLNPAGAVYGFAQNPGKPNGLPECIARKHLRCIGMGKIRWRFFRVHIQRVYDRTGCIKKKTEELTVFCKNVLLIRLKILYQSIGQPVGQRLAVGRVNNSLLVAGVVYVA